MDQQLQRYTFFYLSQNVFSNNLKTNWCNRNACEFDILSNSQAGDLYLRTFYHVKDLSQYDMG